LTDTALALTLTDGSHRIETKAAVANMYAGGNFPSAFRGNFLKSFYSVDILGKREIQRETTFSTDEIEW
jgi:hypothetical protein